MIPGWHTSHKAAISRESFEHVHSSLALGAVAAVGMLLLVVAAVHDFGFRTVPNAVSASLLVCGLILRLLAGEVAWGLAAGFAVFALTTLAWWLGWLGGGDAKLLSAAAVFVPPSLVPTLVIATSLAGGVLGLIYLAGPLLAPRPANGRPAGLVRRALRCEQWRLRRRGPLPYAAAIATGGLFAALAS